MINFLKDLGSALVVALLVGAPMALYFAFVMTA